MPSHPPITQSSASPSTADPLSGEVGWHATRDGTIAWKRSLLGLWLGTWGGSLWLTLVVAPRLGPQAFRILPLLTLPLSFLANVSVWAARVGISTFHRRASRALDAAVSRLWGPFFVASVVFVGGSVASNVVLLDEPTQPGTLVGYALSGLAGMLAGLVAHRLTPWVRGHLPSHRVALRLRMAAWIAGSVVVSYLDDDLVPLGYPAFHLMLEAVVLASGAALCRLACRSWSGTRVVAVSAFVTLAVAAVFPLRPTDDGKATYRAVVVSPGIGRRMVRLLRDLSDGDGDGFSARLGGGDCDDRDRGSFPLSPRGTDCLALARATPRPVDTIPGPTRAHPDLVLLLTIDAFRCPLEGNDHFGRVDGSDCSTLRELARRGRVAYEAHTTGPSTGAAIATLTSGALHPRTVVGTDSLLSDAKNAGYATAAVLTHPYVAPAAVRDEIDVLDDSLVPIAMQPTGTTSEAVTDHAIGLLRRHRASSSTGPLFLWAHYYDPHAPYVATPGSRWAGHGPTSYRSEVRRTDAAIRRLLEWLERSTYAESAWVVVTADHGEEFGEHAGTRHGFTLHEPATRIPIVSFSTGAEPHRFGPARLPRTIEDMRGFVRSGMTGEPYARHDTAIAIVDHPHIRQASLVLGREKLIYHHALQYWELFDLESDPAERHDLALARPERVRELMSLLAAELRVRAPDWPPP